MFCENCGKEHDGEYGSGRFCNRKCARGFSTKHKRQGINRIVSEKLAKRTFTDEQRQKLAKTNKQRIIPRVSKQCLECGKTMQCLPKDKRKFCTSRCWVNYTEKNKEPYLLYRQRCNFTFKVEDFPNKFDLSLIEQHGWYSPSNKGNNINGVSRDHMLSVREGYELGIDPDIIKHPANCQIMIHRKNQSKREKSSISLDELMERIRNW